MTLEFGRNCRIMFCISLKNDYDLYQNPFFMGLFASKIETDGALAPVPGGSTDILFSTLEQIGIPVPNV